MMFDEDLLDNNNLVIHQQISDKKLLDILNPIIGSKTIFSPVNKTESKKITDNKYNTCKDIVIGEGSYNSLIIQKKYRLKLIEYLAKIFTYHSIFISGHFLYKPGQAMGWHTNSGQDGLRIYLNHVTEPKKSVFKYKDREGNIKTSYDQQGWWYRMFKINKKQPLWHCVYSDTTRYSIGIKTLDNLKI